MIRLLFFIVITAMGMARGYSQSLVQTYTDRCTGQTYVFSVPMNGTAVVAFYNKSRTFTAQQFTNGELKVWLEETYTWWQTLSPCSTNTATNQTTQQTTNNATSSATNAAANATNSATSNTPSSSTPNTSSTNTGGGTTNTNTNDTSSGTNTTDTSSTNTNSNSDTSTTDTNTDSSTSSSDTTGSDTSSETGETQSDTTSNESSSDSGGDTDTETESGGSESNEGGDTSSDQEESNNDTESQESTEEESSTESENTESDESEESESDQVEEESTEEETTEESSEEESKEEEKKEKKEEKKKRYNPINISANLLTQSALDGSISNAVSFGLSQSSLTGTTTYSANAMIWDNLNQFSLSVSQSDVYFNYDNEEKLYLRNPETGNKDLYFGSYYTRGSIMVVQSLSASFMYIYGTKVASFGLSNVYMGQKDNAWKGFVGGYALSGTIINIKKDIMIMPSGVLFGTKPFPTKRVIISPMVALAFNPVSYTFSTKKSMFKGDVEINTNLTYILGSNFDLNISQRFKFNIGGNVIGTTTSGIPLTWSATIGSKFQF